MSLTSTVRTAGRDFYLAYLNSPGWRMKRNHALRRANWRCHKCAGKRGLQVHHKSYERLGAEWDQDLEVLCESCHVGHHVEEAERTTLGVYLRLGRLALRERGATTVADLNADLKELCARHKVPADERLIEKALRLLAVDISTLVERFEGVTAKKEPDAPLASAAYVEFLELLSVAVKGFPGPVRTPGEHAEIIAAQIKDEQRSAYRAERRRKPLRERLEEIFS